MKLKFEVVGFVNPKDPLSVTLDQLEDWQKREWINYLGSHEDIRPFINRADCIVFPSYYAEGISRILLEAASMSRPIITSDQVGCKEVVEHGTNGWIVKPKDVGQLVDAIKQCYFTDPVARTHMGRRGRKLVKRYFDERQIIQIYRRHLRDELRHLNTENSIEQHENRH